MTLVPTQVLASQFRIWDLEKRHFFDFEWAKQHVWQKLKTRADFDEVMAQCRQGPYAKWEMAFRHGLGPVGYEQLKKHEKSTEIAACFDLQQTFNAFIKYYQVWADRPIEWNDASNAAACRVVGSKNVFTGRCDDVPDWRTDEQRAQDRHKMARLTQKQQRDIEAVESLLEAIRNGS